MSFWAFVILNAQLPESLRIINENLVVTKNNLKVPTLLYGIAFAIFVFYFMFEKRIKYAKLA